ncbi:hypothetical protein FN846DRAFT_954022 [Sphaerosporella brunnea]|uniref:Uncharacterized protein n=1 Tax=Sphaerosporella brunnea TaxID=1250544 RepID=A0A5J5EUK5_9PEZI|nr:hypothetical protein FN846DRAFT_954022 [Sphaerosporella brunnea]
MSGHFWCRVFPRPFRFPRAYCVSLPTQLPAITCLCCVLCARPVRSSGFRPPITCSPRSPAQFLGFPSAPWCPLTVSIPFSCGFLRFPSADRSSPRSLLPVSLTDLRPHGRSASHRRVSAFSRRLQPSECRGASVYRRTGTTLGAACAGVVKGHEFFFFFFFFRH